MPDYTPIPCIEHERLEFAVLRRQPLRLRVRSEDGTGETLLGVMPLDVYTRDGAEWLSYRTDSGETGTLRLDSILFPLG